MSSIANSMTLNNAYQVGRLNRNLRAEKSTVQRLEQKHACKVAAEKSLRAFLSHRDEFRMLLRKI